MIGLLGNVFQTVHANSLDAFVPEVWAQESLMILEANMVAANLIYRDFEDEIATFGDTVNTRLPAEFTAARKTDADTVTVQDATATNVAVKLDQHVHTSFIIKDGEESKGFENLRDVYLQPALLSIAQMIDEIVIGQCYQFLTLDGGAGNVVGQLGSAATKQSMIALREKMNTNKVPQQGRNVILTPSTEADLLAVDLFVGANQVGDDGTALREASLGRKFGLQTFMAQNTPSISAAAVADTGAVNLAAGYAKGTTTLVCDAFSGAITSGAYFTVAGDDTPQRIVSSSGGPPPTGIVFFPGLQSAVANDAVITVYEHALINNASGYALGYTKDMTIDTLSAAPKLAQFASFGTGSGRKENYSLVATPNSPALTSMSANRALAAAVSDNDVVGLGPDGNYNFGFHRNALALVTRPLAAPASGTGALSYVASYKGLSLRVTITYDGSKQGHLVTADCLLGVKVLDRRLGCVMLG